VPVAEAPSLLEKPFYILPYIPFKVLAYLDFVNLASYLLLATHYLYDDLSRQIYLVQALGLLLDFVGLFYFMVSFVKFYNIFLRP